MSKNRQLLSLRMVLVFVAAGLLVGRSEAQPEQGRRPDPPSLLRIGETRMNPSQISCVQIWSILNSHKHLTTVCGGRELDLEFGTDGQAEALLEWFDAHTTELKPKVVKKK